jgi:transcription elongation factor/antiterminator RfaH
LSISVIKGDQVFNGREIRGRDVCSSGQFANVRKLADENCERSIAPLRLNGASNVEEEVSPLIGTGDSSALGESQRWFLVHSFPKRELQAQMRLVAQGFRTFLPQYLKTTRHARQLRTIRAPLFPRYLFVGLDLGRDRWLSVRSTIGVSCLVGVEDRPTPVPRGIVEALVAQTDGANLVQFGNKLCAGDRVRIVSGPFTDLVGTFERVDDAGRVRLLLDMMGSAIVVTMARSGVLPAA